VGVKILPLLAVLFFTGVGTFYYVHATDAFGLTDWRLEAMLIAVSFGIPLSATARAM